MPTGPSGTTGPRGAEPKIVQHTPKLGAALRTTPPPVTPAPEASVHDAVVEEDDAAREGAGLQQLQLHLPLVLGEVRGTAAGQDRVDPGPVLVDQPQLGRFGGQGGAADGDGALGRLGPQLLDLRGQ